jgi:NTE family protein
VGLTVVKKLDRENRIDKSKVALVLAGGAISGGAFKLGGLSALNAYLETIKVTDFDIYVGCSAGAFLAAPLSAGIPPEELIRSIHGGSSIISQFRPVHFYSPNIREFVQKPIELIRDAVSFWPAVFRAMSHTMNSSRGRALIKRFFSNPSYPNYERFMTPLIQEVLGTTELRRSGLGYLPSGLFDNRSIERFIRTNLRRNRLPNNFRLMHLERKNSLYIAATNLNTAGPVLFGHDENNTATISEAVQASSAIPGFYRPARIGTEEFVDGSVRRTANLSSAAAKGADLIIAYNPFRPYVNLNDGHPDSNFRSMAQMGPAVVLDQVFRTLLHSRLMLGVQKLALDPAFKGNLILIEPTETDARMFNISPLAFWKRAEAAEAGYISVKRTLENHHEEISRILAMSGIRTNLQRLKDDESALRVARHADEAVFDVLENGLAGSPSQRLYVVR